MNLLHHLPLLIVCMITLVEAGSNSWDYGSANGPQNWAKNYKKFCAGVKQSPIDLSVKNSVENLHLKKMNFLYEHNISNADKITITVKNNGHSLKLTWSSNLVIRMGIDSTFTHEAAQLHWHWGSDTSKGSEHTLDGKAYAAEGHLVFFNMDYGNIYNAVDKPNGLAVLGVFNEHSNISNSLIESLEPALENFTHLHEGAKGSITFSVNEFHLTSLFLPKSNHDYFRYDGSLTTPECFESVVWTVFRQAVPISERQLNLLRRLKFADSSTMQDNFRPPSPLNNYDRIASPRTVYRTFGGSAGTLSRLSLAAAVTFVVAGRFMIKIGG